MTTDRDKILFSVTGDSVIVTSADATVTEINPAAERVLGIPAAAVVGRAAGDAFPDLAPLLSGTVPGGTEIRRELAVMTRDGVRDFDAVSIPLLPGSGPAPERLILLRDITERKRQNEALSASDRRFHELVDLLPEIVFECDLSGRFSYVNDNSLRFFGYSRADMEQGLNLFDHIIPEDRPRVREGIGRIADGKKTTGGEYTALKRDGTRVPFLVYTTRVMQGGRCTGIRGIFIDMTERKTNENAMCQAVKKLSLLNSITRHDILNKLTALSAYLNLARDGVTDPLIGNHLEQCHEVVRSVSEHVEFMRDYQEIGIGTPVWQDPELVIRQVSRFHGGLRIHPPAAGYEIFADPLFPKVIDNLVDNAVRHGERVTTITFAISEVPEGLRLLCEDNGAGVPQGDKNRIFEKGFGKHTGLGLFLSREILGITGITIGEYGEPGTGARFVIRVPRGCYRSTRDT